MKSKQVEPKSKIQGEGDREAARRFNEDQKRFVDAGRAPEAARRAAPRDADEQTALERAEKVGRSRSRGEDPALPGASAPSKRRSP